MSDVSLMTVRQFVESLKGGWPHSESVMRAIIYDAKSGKNGFQPAFKKMGKRVLVDVKAFWKCMEEAQKKS